MEWAFVISSRNGGSTIVDKINASRWIGTTRPIEGQIFSGKGTSIAVCYRKVSYNGIVWV